MIFKVKMSDAVEKDMTEMELKKLVRMIYLSMVVEIGIHNE